MRVTAILLTAAITAGSASAFLAPATASADDDQKTETTDEKVRRLINELGNADPEIRERAHEQLKELGEPAVAALEKAIEHPDAEIRWRAKDILAAIRGRRPTPNETPRTRARGPGGSEDPNGNMPGLGGLEELEKLFEGMGGGGNEMKEMLEEMRKLFGGMMPDQEPDPNEKDGRNRSRVRIFRSGPGGQWELQEQGGAGTSAIGAQVRRVPAELRAHLDLPPGAGMLVTRVDDDGIAAKAGLERHDVVFGIDDTIVRAPKDLDVLVEGEHSVKIIRGGKPTELKTSAKRSRERAAPEKAEPEKSEGKRRNY